MVQAIHELESLSRVLNLRLNKAESQFLTKDFSADIAGIPAIPR